jgi:type IV pilus assembly protein PilE
MNKLNRSGSTAVLPRRPRGFTLIELVIAMLIAATLAAIAIPAYSNYARKARRVEAKTALLDIGALEERYFSVQQVYSTSLTDMGYGAGATVNVGGGYYSVAAPTVNVAIAPTATTAGSPANWSVVATAINDQLKDTTCRTFTVTSGGSQTAADSSNNDTTATCWR